MSQPRHCSPVNLSHCCQFHDICNITTQRLLHRIQYSEVQTFDTCDFALSMSVSSRVCCRVNPGTRIVGAPCLSCNLQLMVLLPSCHVHRGDIFLLPETPASLSGWCVVEALVHWPPQECVMLGKSKSATSSAPSCSRIIYSALPLMNVFHTRGSRGRPCHRSAQRWHPRSRLLSTRELAARPPEAPSGLKLQQWRSGAPCLTGLVLLASD